MSSRHCAETVSATELIADGRRAIIDAGVPPSEAQLEARLLFQHAADIPAEQVIGNPELTTTESVAETYASYIARRVAREPLPYIVGTVSFYGRTYQLTPDVLIPRPETEQLVDLAIQFAHEQQHKAPRICDLGTGSGVMAISLALELPDAAVVACDIDQRVLNVARRNAAMHGMSERIEFVEADMTSDADVQALGTFDIVVSNPPYIPNGRLDHELEPEVSEWEPRRALDGGDDGMRILEPLIRQLPRLLNARRPSAAFIEIDHCAAGRCLELAAEAMPEASARVERDLAGLSRVVGVRG